MNLLNVEVSLDTYDNHCALSDDHALYRGALCVHKSSRDSNNCQLSLRRKFLLDNLYMKSLHVSTHAWLHGYWNSWTRWMCVQQDSSSLLHLPNDFKVILKSCQHLFTLHNIRRMLVCIAASTCMIQRL